MDRTGWPRVYQGVYWGLLQGLCNLLCWTTGRTDLLLEYNPAGESIISPAADEARLRYLILAIDSVLDHCEETLQQTRIRFCQSHLALLQQIWEHRLWDNLDAINELKQFLQWTSRPRQPRAQLSPQRNPYKSSDIESDKDSLTDLEKDKKGEEKD
ncbi:hypothetical protein BDV23DRAFT_184844 [Aspergillus alliaceus]|uniref:Uncharacterized protein n=1 Tax=Petromyces alliaceus TaxID=209559 RepID=A0A5N7C568_PETAA|nr:hypothetical protein BDV23DRAFT_184844 [Aspergillus alliaceus]